MWLSYKYLQRAGEKKKTITSIQKDIFMALRV